MQWQINLEMLLVSYLCLHTRVKLQRGFHHLLGGVLVLHVRVFSISPRWMRRVPAETLLQLSQPCQRRYRLDMGVATGEVQEYHNFLRLLSSSSHSLQLQLSQCQVRQRRSKWITSHSCVGDGN